MATEQLSSKLSPTYLNRTFDQDDTVTLLVCPTEHAITTHGNYISHKSDFFKAALKKEWTEGQTRTIKLPDECPLILNHYLSYTYGKRLPTDVFNDIHLGAFAGDSDDYYQLLAELYVLSGRLLDNSIQISLIKEFVRLAKLTDKDNELRFPMKEAVNTIHRSTTAGCPARRLMVDIHLTHGKTEWFDSTCEAAFLLDVAQSLYTKFDKH